MGKREDILRADLPIALGAACVFLLGLTTAGANAAPLPSQEEMWRIIQAQQREIKTLKAERQQLETQSAEAPQAISQKPQEPAQKEQKVEELERKTDVLTEEVEKLRTQLIIPEEPEYKSIYGLGPAASKIYQVSKGLSIGGYGEAFYQNLVEDEGDGSDSADLVRLVLYTGYRFTDRILFNSEIEFEHATTGEGDEEKGEVSVEFANLDFLLHPLANIRAGLVLIPVGFINEIHEPPFFHGNNRPEVERRIIPTTWREIGGGLFGELLPGFQYRIYAVNGLRAEGFESEGIREGRQSGSRALAEDWAFTGRLDYSPTLVPGLLVGASAFLGNSGQDEEFAGQRPDVFTQLYEGHLQWRYRGFEFRALGAWGHIDDAEVLSAAKGETIGEENFGWYVETAYDVMPLIWPGTTQYLAPFFRYEQFDTIAEAPAGFSDDPNLDREIFQGGISYKPIPNVVIKADYRNFNAKEGEVADEFNLGLGFIF
jgi:hypothetical protein